MCDESGRGILGNELSRGSVPIGTYSTGSLEFRFAEQVIEGERLICEGEGSLGVAPEVDVEWGSDLKKRWSEGGLEGAGYITRSEGRV